MEPKNGQTHGNQTLQPKSYQRRKYQGKSLSKVLGTILKVDKGGIQKIRQEFRKLTTMLNVLCPNDDIVSIISRKEVQRELASIGNCVDAVIQGVENYFRKSKEILITAASNNIGKIIPEKENKNQGNRNVRKIYCMDILSNTNGIAHEKTWT